MGQVLYNYYIKAGAMGGIKARTQFSMLTRVSSLEAKSLPDHSDYIALFDKTLQLISQEFGITSEAFAEAELQKTRSESTKETADCLRKQIGIITDLTAQRSLYIGDPTTAYKRITESMAEGIDVARASIWLYNEDRRGITCADLFTRNNGMHSSGVFLASKDFPAYFKSIEAERTLAAHHAHTDVRTVELSQLYLRPLGIESMLDVPIWSGGSMIGVLCFEHVGPARFWNTDEENFAYLMSNIVAMVIEKNQ